METTRESGWRRWVGLGLVGLSGVCFAGLFVVPAMPLSLQVKGGLALGLAVLMELAFWVGSVIVGKQVLGQLWRAVVARRETKAVVADQPRDEIVPRKPSDMA
jgi:hypothetical protein